MRDYFNWSAGLNGVLEYGERREPSPGLYGSPITTPTVTLARDDNTRVAYTSDELMEVHNSANYLSQRDIDGLSRIINRMIGQAPEKRDVRPKQTREGEGLRHTRFPTQKGPNRT